MELTKRTHTMTLNQSALLELTDVLRTADGGQVMRLMLSAMLQALVDAEATAHIGANPYEHTPTRTTQRNGTREKTVSTTAGDLMVKIPKLRAGSFFPSLLAPRRRIDVALYAVVMEAYVHGVDTSPKDIGDHRRYLNALSRRKQDAVASQSPIPDNQPRAREIVTRLEPVS